MGKGTQQIFTENFSRLRRERNVTLKDIADYIGVSITTIHSWQSGKKMPRMDKFDRLCEFFQVKRSYFVTEHKPTYYHDSEVAEIADEMKNNSDLRVLFKASRKLNKDSIKEVQNFVDFLYQKQEGDNID